MAHQPEQLNLTPENNLEQVGRSAEGQSEIVASKYEQAGERGIENGEASSERAKVEALESAISIEAGGIEKHRHHDAAPSTAKPHRPAGKKVLDASYRQTMNHVQQEMSVHSRTFSRIIHNKAVERVSETVGTTVARPNAIMTGAFAALVLTSLVYFIARYYGYPLSGSESIAAFIAGWLLGLLYDFFRIMITGKRP